MATIVIFFPLTVSLHSGFKQVDPDYEVLFRPPRCIFLEKKMRLLYWPAALPSFLPGLRWPSPSLQSGSTWGMGRRSKGLRVLDDSNERQIEN